MVLVRYAEVGVEELRELLTDSWRERAPKRLRATFEAHPKGRTRPGTTRQ